MSTAASNAQSARFAVASAVPLAAAAPPADAGKSPVPKAKRVTLILETSAVAKKRYGADAFSQILYMRLDGLGICEIAETLGCSRDIVQSMIDYWQDQIERRESRETPGWEPRRRNRRRWAQRACLAEPLPALSLTAAATLITS